MLGVDSWPAAHGDRGAMALIAAGLLRLRHATHPDHLPAISTQVLGARRAGTPRAGVLGLAWGLGHAVTLFLFGLPVILLGTLLPSWVSSGAEKAIGVVIVILAARLLLRWSRGTFHSHSHAHGGLDHSHPHVHELGPHDHHGYEHSHAHEETLGRSPLAAFGIGLLHGTGGSAAAGVLLVGMIQGRGRGVLALVLFAAATAISMALVSTLFGHALVRSATPHRLERWVPLFSLAGIVFGAWYALK